MSRHLGIERALWPVDEHPRPVRPWRRRVIVGSAIVLVVLLLAGMILGWSLWRVRHPRLDAVPEHADAIVVFAGDHGRVQTAWVIAERGHAPVLVLSRGAHDPYVALMCGRNEPFQVICTDPSPANTRGEARAFGELAAERGWRSLIAVTGTYHLERARLYLDRCFDGDVAYVGRAYSRVGWKTQLHETLGGVEARFLSGSSC
jgi:uncharacterized SAM-binding protein YcdF (DUF218 family)